jgi:hypothetical protein
MRTRRSFRLELADTVARMAGNTGGSFGQLLELIAFELRAAVRELEQLNTISDRQDLLADGSSIDHRLDEILTDLRGYASSKGLSVCMLVEWPGQVDSEVCDMAFVTVLSEGCSRFMANHAAEVSRVMPEEDRADLLQRVARSQGFGTYQELMQFDHAVRAQPVEHC